MCGLSLEPAPERLIKTYDALQVAFVLVFGVMYYRFLLDSFN